MDLLHPFDLKRPRSVAEAAALLAAEPAARPVAGGTDLLPNLRRGLERPTLLVDLTGIDGFAGVALDADGVSIGAGTTLAAIAADARIREAYPALAEAALAVAAPAHRNAATLGGNLCLDTRCVYYNQSEWWRAANGWCLKRGGTTCHVAPQGERCHAAFAGDVAPALLVHDAEVELASAHGTRRVALGALYRDDGAAHLALAPGELLVRVRLPAATAASGYRKARVRGSIDFPLAGVAAALALHADGTIRTLRVALTGTNSHPLRLDGTDALAGQRPDDTTLAALGKLVQKQASPMRTTVTAANYRRQVASVLAQRLVRELAQRPGTGRP